MAQTIYIKNSEVAGVTPTSLGKGEIAINISDGNLFYGDAGGNVSQNFSFLNSGATSIGALTATSGTFRSHVNVSGDTRTGGNVYVQDAAGLYTDKIRRYSANDNTTKILLNSNVIKIHVGHSTDELLNLAGNEAEIDGALTVNSGITSLGNVNISGTTTASAFVGNITGNVTGNADTVTNGVYTSNNLSVMAATTSTQLAGVISDETGTGLLVFGTNPVLTTPNIGTPTAGVLTNATGYPGDSSLLTTGVVTTGTWASNRKFELSVEDVGDAEGDITYIGDSTVTTRGKIYMFDTSGAWTIANATDVDDSTGLLAVALGDLSDENGMLLRGMATLHTDPGAVGLPIYLSTTAGLVHSTAPSAAGNVVRVIGYNMSTSSPQVWFNPDNTWVELS